MLSIQAGQTLVASPGGALALPVGTAAVAAFFRGGIPGGAELEAAIDRIEDAIMGVGPVTVDASQACDDAGVRAVAAAAGLDLTRDAVLAVDAIERLFTRMAAAAAGALPARDALPPGASFAATLLVLREVMHHLQIRDIRLEASDAN